MNNNFKSAIEMFAELDKLTDKIVYFDSNGKTTENKNEAVKAIISQYNDKGDLVNEIFANVNNSFIDDSTENKKIERKNK